MRWLTRLARAPVLHFLVLGGGLYALFGPPSPARLRPARDDGGTIVLSAAQVEQLRGEWTRQRGVPPAPSEETALLEAAVDEEVLHREALRLGLDRHDPLVSARLVQLARYLEEGPIEDEAALERDARALGLARTDLVLRRYLVQAVRLVAAGTQQKELPTEDELEAYLGQHGAEFAQPGRTRFVHVYLSADRRGAMLTRDARALAARLRSREVGPEDAPALGDPFVLGPVVPLAPAADIDRRFGPGFASAVETAPPGAWAGPLPSAYGLHFVWVQERQPARVPSLAEVRGQVLHRVLRERRQARVRTAVARLRQRYEIRVEGH